MAKPEPIKSGSRSDLSLTERRDIFGSSDDSDAPSPGRSRSLESDRSGSKRQFNDDDGDAVMLHDQDDRTGRGVGTFIDTTQKPEIAASCASLSRKRRGCLLSEC